MKIGWNAYSPRFPLEIQRKAQEEWGAEKVYEDSIDHLVMALRSDDTLGVYGLHRLAPNWKGLEERLTAIEAKDVAIYDLELQIQAGLASMARARSVYAGQAIFAAGEGPKERGARGGRPRRVHLNGEHEAIWRDIERYPTNKDAARAISELVHAIVTVRQLQRAFRASGRPGGWPKKD